jgi:hypothetical protein
LVVLVEPVLLGLAGLVAHQSTRVLGTEWLVVGVLGWHVITAIIVRGGTALRDRRGREIGVRLVGAQAAALSVVVAAAPGRQRRRLLLAGRRGGPVPRGGFVDALGAPGRDPALNEPRPPLPSTA